jgi:hypothetical protein
MGFVLRIDKESSDVETLKLLYIIYVRFRHEYASLVWSPIFDIRCSFFFSGASATQCQKKNTICEWILDWEAQDENFFEKICLMDEATFSRNGVSNLRCHQNPHLFRVCIINISAAGLQGEWPLVDRIM